MDNFYYPETKEAPEDKFYYPEGPSIVPLSPEVAEERAKKFDVALGSRSPGLTQLTNDIQIGAEDDHRQLAAQFKAYDNQNAKTQLIGEIAKNGGPQSPEETELMFGLTQEDIPVPQTIMEKEFAKRAISDSIYAAESPTIDRGLVEDPEGTNTALDAAENTVAIKEGIQKRLEDVEATIQDQSWLGWGADFFSSWIPFATWGNMAAATGDEFNLPGEIPADFRDSLLFMPVDEAMAKLDPVLDELKTRNPQEAAMFLRHLLQYSSSEQLLDTVLIAGGDITAFPLIKGAKAGVQAVKGLRGAKKATETTIVSQGGKATTTIETTADIAGQTKPAGMSDEAWEGLRSFIEKGKQSPNPAVQATANQMVEHATDATRMTPQEQTRKGLRDIVSNLFKRRTTPEEQLAAAGHVDEAAVQGAIKEIRENIAAGMRTADKPGEVASWRGRMPHLFDPDGWISTGSKNLSREQQRRLVNEVDNSTPSLLRAMSAGLKIDRLPESDEMIEAMVQQGRERVRLQYPQLADTIIDAEHTIVAGPAGDVHQVGVIFGDENASLFKSANAAAKHAQMQGFDGFRVGQKGSGFYYQVYKNVDETAPDIRAHLLETSNQTPRSMASMFLGFRTPEDLVSQVSREDRKVAVFGIGELTSFLKPSAERIGALPKKSRQDLYTFIENDRVYETTITENGITKTEVGRFATSLSEFENRWHDTFRRYPTEREAVAYLEYVRLTEVDWAFRNFRLYRDKARLGIEDLTFGKLSNVEAKSVDSIAWDSPNDAGILVLQKGGEPRFTLKSDAPSDLKALIARMEAQNGRTFQLSPFGDRRLRGDETIGKLVGDEKIHFVVSDDYKINPLSIKQLPNRPGGHIAYPDGFFAGQAKVTKTKKSTRYDHDVNIWQFTNEAKAAKFADALDKVRVMLRNGVDDKAISDFIEKSVLPKTPAEIFSLFRGEAPRLSLDEKIAVRGAGERLGDKLNLKDQYADFVDDASDPHNLYANFGLDYTGTRNSVIETMEDVGSQANPIYRTRPAKLVDAMSTLNRGVQQMVKARFLDDLKTKEAEKFVQEFGHVLNVSREELLSNPFKHIYNPVWRENADRMEVMAAKNSLMALKQFIGLETQYSKNLKWVKNKMMNSIYNRFGEKVTEAIEAKVLYTTSDPLKYARGLAFHMKLGLFNPVQIFLQAQTFTHTAAIAGPKIALKAGPGAALMRGLRFTDKANIIEDFANKAAKLGWNKEDFKEAYAALRESGMDRVAGEVAMRDDVYDPQLVQTAMGKFGDWSTFFFNEGERFTRVSAYNAAYLEWRTANGVAKLTPKAKKQILERADLLSGNMTRASNAAWQRGFLSIPTQFFAYQARIAEQLLGKRLTRMEKARVLGMYSAIYGLPVAASAGTAAWPWGETIRNELTARGIDYDDNIVSKALMDGLVSVALETATGTKFNVGERYGPGGLNAFRDWLTGEKDGAELLLGVSGSVISDTYESLVPIATEVANVFSGNQDSYPLLINDMIDATKEISSVNNALKTYYGLNYGKYITKNEMYLTDVDGVQSMFMGLSGLTPQTVGDTFTMRDILKAEKEAKEEAGTQAIKYIKRALRSVDADDIINNLKRAKTWIVGAGMNVKEGAQVFSRAMHGYESYADQTAWEFAKSKPERMQQYIKDKEKK